MKKQLVLLCLFSLLLVSGVLGAYRFYEPYYGGFGSGSLSGYFDMFLNLIQENEYLVDAIVFLIVFLILAKKALPEKFKEDKALYVVIGIALTIGIMVYERRAGYSLIINSGWLSLILLLVFGAYIASSSGARWSPLRVIVLSLLVLIALYIVPSLFPTYQYAIEGHILYGLSLFLAVVGIIVGVVWLIFWGGQQPRGRYVESPN